jgi:alpha-methylacyl-CoA racemase
MPPTGPLAGTRVLEVQGIGPGPFAATALADLGADVLRVDRVAPGGLSLSGPTGHDVLSRSRRSVALDLKHPEGPALLLRLVATADVLLEGFRPGVAERLGFGPDVCLQANPRLVYGRMTGWGQDGPLAHAAGHDLDYIAVAGALHPMGRPDRPPPVPLNLVGDFGGGGMLLVVGVLAALVERAASGRGQVVDAAMVDGAALLTGMFHGMASQGLHDPRRRGGNLLDGGAPFYDVYECADGGYVAVGALEPQFYAALLDGLGLPAEDWPQFDLARWPALRAALADVFAAADRDHWAAVFEGGDACVAPVLRLDEAPDHHHLAARGTFVEVDGVVQPAPAPRFSRTATARPTAPPARGSGTRAALAEIGLDDAAVDDLLARGVVACADVAPGAPPRG